MKRVKRTERRRGAMAQEAEQLRGPEAKDGGAAGTRQAQEEQEAADPPQLLDQELVDEYLSVPTMTTIHDILLTYDPRCDMDGIYEGIEHGGYRRALEKLLPNPPPRDLSGGRLDDNRARMLERLGRYEEAEALYRDMADEEPGLTDSQIDMARVLEHLGRRKESAEALARACRLDPDARRAFEAGMRPDPRQADPSAVPLRLVLPMSVISAAGTMRSRAEIGAASMLVQAECGLDLYPPSGSRLHGCAGLGADMERFHHLVVEDVLPYYDSFEQPYYYDLTDVGIDMVGRLGERLDREGGGIASRIAASSRRVAQVGTYAVLEEACGMAASTTTAVAAAAGRDGDGDERAATLAGLQGTVDRIRREIGNGIVFGEEHASLIESKATRMLDMLSQARDAPGRQWAVAAALAGDVLGLCSLVVFDQRPHPRMSALGPPYPDMQDLYSLFVGYCRARGIAEVREGWQSRRWWADSTPEEMTRDMLKVIAGS